MEQVVVGVRDLRAKLNIVPTQKIKVILKAEQMEEKDFLKLKGFIIHLAKLDSIELKNNFKRSKD